jgi:hypothetical protein
MWIGGERTALTRVLGKTRVQAVESQADSGVAERLGEAMRCPLSSPAQPRVSSDSRGPARRRPQPPTARTGHRRSTTQNW